MIKWLESGTGERKEIYLPYSFRKQTKQYFTASLTLSRHGTWNMSILETEENLEDIQTNQSLKSLSSWEVSYSLELSCVVYPIGSYTIYILGMASRNENNSWAALSSGHLRESALHATPTAPPSRMRWPGSCQFGWYFCLGRPVKFIFSTSLYIYTWTFLP